MYVAHYGVGRVEVLDATGRLLRRYRSGILLTSNVSFHVRRNALTLILRTGKWQKLPALLNACVDEDGKIAGLAKKSLRDWFVDPQRAPSGVVLYEAKLSLSSRP